MLRINLFVITCLAVTCFASCSKTKIEDNIPQTTQTKPVSQGSNSQIMAATGWIYSTQSWSTVGGTATGWIFCYNAQGTNQNAKRAVFTVSNNNVSARAVDVTIQVTSSGCANTPGQQVASFTVPKGSNVTNIINVSGYPLSENRLRINIRPSGPGAGSFTGLVTYGYEQ